MLAQAKRDKAKRVAETKRQLTHSRRIFLSYSSADRDFARDLASQLSKRGFDVWDPGDKLAAGDNWLLRIGRALQESKAMVVLVSPDSIRSEWVRRELEYAIGDRKYEGRLFPVLVRPTAEVPWILRKLNMLHADNDPATIGDRIASALK